MLSDILLRHWLTLHGAVIAIGLAFYVTIARAFPQRRDPSAAIAWVVALTLLPYLALPLYIMVGSRKLLLRDAPLPGPPPSAIDFAGAVDGPARWTQRLGRSMGLSDAARYEHLQVHVDGSDALRALREVLEGAVHRLDVCTFILAHDALGDEVVATLERRARDGVEVRLMVDGVGGLLGGHVDYKALRAAGVEVVRFVPPFRSILRGRANLRNHRKMVIADERRLWCGGRNFASEYFEGRPLHGGARRLTRSMTRGAAWHDLTFDLVGAVAVEASRQFALDWAYATRVAADKDAGVLAPLADLIEPDEPGEPDADAPDEPYAAVAPDATDRATARPSEPRADQATGFATQAIPAGAALPVVTRVIDAGPIVTSPHAPSRTRMAQLVPSGPDQVDDTVQVLLVSGCFMARRRILAVTPYFVPDATLLQALTLAARRGLAVDLVLPARSNHRMADIARNRPLRALVAAGAQVWLVPHMVHAKGIVIDDDLALVGSANLDARSLFLNYELMVAFYRPDDVRRFAAWIDTERGPAVAYTADTPGLVRDLAEGLLLWLAFQL